jgi:uncharacterized membrane protein YeiH
VSESLTPTEGARFLLERIAERDGGAEYRATIFTPEATYAGTATLGETGSVVVEIQGAQADLVEVMQMLAKLTARSAAKKREDGFPPWPARVLRWRGPGRG